MSADRLGGFGMIDYSGDTSAYPRCGDALSIEVEVDPAFDLKEYEIQRGIANICGPIVYGPKFQILERAGADGVAVS